ncbi:hypothetical protein [Castellaniella sp.]|uniref:hypothetical protein n=1 Tax=Castellaniella sp. TaxID=1955812 RepID=UPI002AFFAE3F|nr:hypothetical protein [Castellaniella sp.]
MAAQSSKKFASGMTARTIYMGAAVVLFLTWQITDHVITRMRQMPVKMAPKVNHQGDLVDPKSFYPVWVKQAVALKPIDPDMNVDAFFRKKEQPAAQEPLPAPAPEPDYVALFAQQVRIDGITDNGVFLNGRFVKLGSELQSLSVQRPNGGSVIPVLSAISMRFIEFRIGEQSLRIPYREPT